MLERRDLPLFSWDDALRAARARRTRLRRRTGLAAAGIACLVSTILDRPLPRLVWNASASAPIGLYRVAPGARLARGDMVIAWPPLAVRDLAATRYYLPRNVPLVKRIVGVVGDRICASGNAVTINGRIVALRRTLDGAGRPLPAWQGCIALGPRTLFLLMAASPNSFDGRYFGPTDASDIIGKAAPMWVW